MRRYVDVYTRKPDGRYSSGSGYLLGGALVLTAAHVVSTNTEIVVYTELGQFEATIGWTNASDIALLLISTPIWPAPTFEQAVRWGRFVTINKNQVCSAIGFPRAVAKPARRDSHTLNGYVNPESLIKARRYAVDVTDAPSRSEGPSPWAGMSGAALLAPDTRGQDLLVGVVTEEQPEFGRGRGRLLAAPIIEAAEDPVFVRLVEKHTGSSLVVEPVELAGIEEEERHIQVRSPAGLLRASAAATPFRHRPELDDLLEWCHGNDTSWIRLVIGPGGQGKTRLARHIATQLTAQGWATLVLDQYAAPSDFSVLSQVRTPALVVVDYAEGRAHQLGQLIRTLERTEAKVRLLLLARTAGDWRTELVEPDKHADLLTRADIVVELGPVEPHAQGRRQAWTQAATELAKELATIEGYTGDDHDWPAVAAAMMPPPLEGDRYHTILAVQIDALATLLQGGKPPAGDGEEVLLDHERRYWERVAARFGIAMTASTRLCLVTNATLWGAPTDTEARETISALLPLNGGAEHSRVADWLASLYHTGQHFWSGLEPDVLAEYLVATTLASDDTDRNPVPATVAVASRAQLDQALTLLGRAHPQYPHLTQTIDQIVTGNPHAPATAIAVAPRLDDPGPLVGAVRGRLPITDLPKLRQLKKALPGRSLVLADLSVEITDLLAQRLESENGLHGESHLASLVEVLHDLSVRYAHVGRLDDALEASTRAIENSLELARINWNKYAVIRWTTLRTHSLNLGLAGKTSEAIALARESLQLAAELAREDPRHLALAAGSFGALGRWLAADGRTEEALAAGGSAVRIWERVALRKAQQRDGIGLAEAHNNLASAANSLGERLRHAGRLPEALVRYRQAVDLLEELIADERDAYLVDLARSLHDLAICFKESGDTIAALAASRRSTDLYKEAVARSPSLLNEFIDELATFIDFGPPKDQIERALADIRLALRLSDERRQDDES